MNEQLSAEASRCVKCGLCLSECPTYQLTRNEACSPRGRIALATALHKQQIPVDRQFMQRIDSCLLCRRCEKLCPSGVKFGRIMDAARALQNQHKLRLQSLLAGIISGRVRLRRILRSIQWLRPFNPAIPKLAPAADLAHYNPALGTRIGSVGLFKGCSAEALEPQVLQDAIRLLNRAGQDVHIPVDQVCCGALHAHAGNKKQAAALSATNKRALSDQPFDTLVSIATGCGAHLSDDEQRPVAHLDICAFLARPDIVKRLDFKPLHATAALFIPCTLKNILGSEQAVVDLLGNIPALELQLLNSDRCCGAAGTYFITHGKTARQLRQPVISQIEQVAPDYLLSSNIGCSLHLIQGLGKKPPMVMHPVSLLAQQLLEH